MRASGCLARTLWRVHVSELALYIVVAGVFSWSTTLAPRAIALTVFAAALGVRLSIVALSFALAYWFRSQPRRGPRLSLAGNARLFLGEFIAFVVLFSFLQPLERWFRPTNIIQAPARARPLVLFIHGIYCNGAVWYWLARRLRARGISGFAVSLDPLCGDIESYATQLQRDIERVCQAGNAAQVVLVAHSMGGVVARAYLRRYGAQRVSKLITLGCPHHGSELARLALGRSERDQLRPANAWLCALNLHEREPPPVPMVSIFSWHDNFVAPPGSAEFATAKDIALAGIGHLSMLFSKQVETLLLEALSAPVES